MAVSARGHESDLSAKKEVVAAPVLRAIPIYLAGMLEPYKKHGKLTLRVERVPTKAKFSNGTRNGNNSWSLTRDQLDDLKYLLPDDVDENHTLMVRIIGLERGDILSVRELPVEQAKIPDQAGAAGLSAVEAELQQLRKQLQNSESLLSARNDELVAARKEVERLATVSATRLEEGLTSARAQWEIEQAAQLAALESKWKENSAKDSSAQKEQFAAERQRWQSEATGFLARAEQSWKQEEAERIGELRHQWEQETLKAVAAARVQVTETVTASDDAALRQLREEMARREAQLADREAQCVDQEAALARAQAAVEHDRAQWNLEMQDAISAAEQNWRAREAMHLAAAENQWRAEAAVELRNAAARASAAEAAVTKLKAQEGLQRALQGEIDFLRATLAVRDAELTQARDRLGYRQFLADEPVAPEAAQKQADAVRNVERSKKFGVAVAAAVVLGLGTVGGFFLAPLFNASPIPAPVTRETPVAEPPPLPTYPPAVLLENVRLRSEPSKKAPAVARAERGFTVLIKEQKGEWTLVRFYNKTETYEGWVLSETLALPDANARVR